jgi:hypothetical protein
MAASVARGVPRRERSLHSDEEQFFPIARAIVCARDTLRVARPVGSTSARRARVVQVVRWIPPHKKRNGGRRVDTMTGNGSQDSTVQNARRVAAEKFDEGRELAMNLIDRVETMIRERPGTSLLVALGAGFLIGRLVRR